jgi:predicted transcriptional regulator
MPERLLDSAEVTAGGVLTLASTAFIQIYEWVTLENINDFIELALAVGGGVFLWYKIKGQKIDNESKKLDNELKRKQLKDE